MTDEALIAFALCFGAGPLIFAILRALKPGVPLLILLALAVGAAMLAALVMQMQAQIMGSLVALWIGWVLAVSLVALALQRRVTHARARRWIIIIGLLATPLPWFGLATAQLLTT